jgi:EAL domain-containing protein (putative c-di-GMP-specific phosphodiesterase class I)
MSGLRQALTDKGLTVAYQPIYQATSGKLMGMEALMRWQHPSQGLLNAGSFLPQVSQANLLIELNHWVMQSAMHQFAAWRRQGLSTGWLSLNVSPAQLHQGAFREMLIGLLEQHDLEPSQMVLEITEETFFNAESTDHETMQQLVALGIRFAIDDFGTGYSNLSYLQRLPVQIIKIDHAFTQKLSSEQGKAILRGLTSIARNLGFQTIYEGIETEEQLAFVQAEGCDMVQGYRLSRPLLEEGMLELLRLPNI